MSIFNAVADFLREKKNEGLSALVRKFINNKIEDYGEMVNLQIDSKNKNLFLEVLLKGEKESITIKIDHYNVVEKNGKTFVSFGNVSASREWIQVMLENVAIPKAAPGNMIEIESSYAKIIDILI